MIHKEQTKKNSIRKTADAIVLIIFNNISKLNAKAQTQQSIIHLKT
jgi:hypothetical protein